MSSLFDEMMEEICEKNQKISDLEAKLAESEKKAYSRGHSQRDIDNEIKLNALREDIANKEKRIIELKKQLAVKEKEVENIKLCRCVNCTNEYEFMLEGLVEDLEKQIDKDDQDKISFAVEKLEETRKLIANLDMPDSPVLYNDDMFQAGFDSHYVRTRQTIDNQIKQLKEGV